MECIKHPGSSIVSVCITCGATLVCVDCMTDKEHKGHVFEKPNKIAIDIKAKLKPKETEDCKLEANLESDLKEIRSLKTQQDNKQKERVKSINIQKEVLIQTVTEMTDSFISQYETQTHSNCVKLQDAIDVISTKLENVRRHRNEIERLLDEKDVLAVVNDSRNLKDVDGQRKPYPQLAEIEFTRGKVNIHQLKIMFGGTAAELNELATLEGAQVVADMTLSVNKSSDFVGTDIRLGRELVLESTLKYSESNYVSAMRNDSYGNSWVKCHGERKISLIDKSGHVDKTVTFYFGVRGMTTTKDNTLLLCGVEDRDIKQVILPSGNATSVFSTGKLFPFSVCTTPSGDLYVTLMDSRDYNVTANSERVLVRYSSQGQEKDRARYDRRGDPLFVGPYRVRVSNTGVVIGVSNLTDKQNSHLVLLNTDLTLRLRYLGNGKVVSGEEKFDTTTYKPETNYAINDFIFDSFDNIIIVEVYSKCVQLLSRDCVQMCTLLPTQEYTPVSMTMNGDRMWLGFQNGTVNVYKYE
ncbi:uncharacterized protein LOC110441099 [Mizuhopecten yessoensis]|uniref:B box-type domain-containing protein n=1 Tax=Mizuhopecten yessoensis TaxID=6573 RepID=A0A210PJZ2_MIZYE|nr:uncharacterized protein LOC110441099 [Mizuhopecten yessoensis]XP_021339875.1 uncharacterized protein LOC110441099 [Mizuhopecten yessoensis]OWF36807.1 hypothetical protein KP79_PYT22242 [Mizuhopecten yessoensis]